MGGKTWSVDEERMLWEVVVPRSVAAANPADRGMSWEQCAQYMNDNAGDIAQRNYTKNMLYEHHYQNIVKGGSSPNAGPFVERHLRLIEWYKNHRSPPPASPPPVPRPLQNPELTALLSEQSKPKRRRGKNATKTRVAENRNALPTIDEDGPGPGLSGSGTSSVQYVRSFAPYDWAQQQSFEENQSPPDDPRAKYALDFRPLPRTVRAARPGGNFLSRPMEKLEGGLWRLVPETRENENLGESMSMVPRNSNVQARHSRAQEESSWTRPYTGPPQRSPQGPQGGSLPSIRQTFPFINFRQPPNSAPLRETSHQTGKRGYSGGQDQNQAPKRRRLPDRPVPRQSNQQPSSQRK
ncbi:hypothetical protein FOXG_07833 [Fusarium oxysporum f. sp. lycopersici 4287]|uniref:Uncharacterized protein n=3 Tax=Fusarium oxysporum TaxID=5507 RepID=A0A0J9WMJ0_FUSO4|nr:hypothetical protein FOXG_07833 [Fusarium oxysporum f. sp. lycopersici 4287]EXK45596.1 hypothetical protein FOMG_03969 [Fusarium oxysporum f. sp. melonis 26406]EXK45597.1 hypothetical protein FOMG_03969 [Fusarium oxysporum f. sp. melonis 26406]KAJ9426487.1 hypothetical protein QL093DRAFT_2183690 [Fusarium oxysporum]KNB05617.1 hypothetical protein FOXG_07833 [Fusarium oxysporum f. sp. lycopersici 4287]